MQAASTSGCARAVSSPRSCRLARLDARASAATAHQLAHQARRSGASALLISALLVGSPGHALATVSPVVAAPGSAVVAGAARVVDGDTLVVNGETRVRLYGVDAPETKQLCTRPDGSAWTCGVSAGDALRAMVADAGGEVHCVVLNQDRYGRDVALCDAGGNDLGSWMVERGWALAYKAYGGTAFAKPEALARDNKAGVWVSNFTPPWEWRAQQRASKGGAKP